MRYRTLIIDESHNLRNREGKRYKAILQYIELNEPRVILLTATPYNKHYTDLSNQIRLFKDEKAILPARPERFLQAWRAQNKNEADFRAQFQAPVESLIAFEKSEYPEDWRDLMRHFMVRRTRHFVMRHYAQYDEQKQRYFVTINQKRFYFPVRQPKTLRTPQTPAYNRFYSEPVIQIIETLNLPRYGLGLYLDENKEPENATHKKIVEDLGRAGKRLIGFCRTNLFKRLESTGHTFLLSVKRHILRNLITLHALENNLEVPIGTQDVAQFDTSFTDADTEFEIETLSEDLADAPDDLSSEAQENTSLELEGPELERLELELQDLQKRAREYYEQYRNKFRNRFCWLPASYFTKELQDHLRADTQALFRILQQVQIWTSDDEPKLQQLITLLEEQHPNEKVLIFTQFSDTAFYIEQYLQQKGVQDVECITSKSGDPVALARRFSPCSNGGLKPGETELRVLIATDVLSEGQNLQDCHIVVNFDLPWTVIRIVQRAGRVDRIGQEHSTILVYSFLPAEGVEEIIQLRKRLEKRLRENQEVIGTDESFFGEPVDQFLTDLYAEKPGVLDEDEDDSGIDITSLAMEAWNSASEADRQRALDLPQQVYAVRPHCPTEDSPEGAIVFVRSHHDTERYDTLVRLDSNGNLVSQSLSSLFEQLRCEPDTPNLPPEASSVNLFPLVQKAVEDAKSEAGSFAGALGTRRSLRRQLYERLENALQKNTLPPPLKEKAQRLREHIYMHPLLRSAEEAIRSHLKMDIPDEQLVEALDKLNETKRLFNWQSREQEKRVEIVCTIGFAHPDGNPSFAFNEGTAP